MGLTLFDTILEGIDTVGTGVARTLDTIGHETIDRALGTEIFGSDAPSKVKVKHVHNVYVNPTIVSVGDYSVVIPQEDLWFFRKGGCVLSTSVTKKGNLKITKRFGSGCDTYVVTRKFKIENYY
jgi:hypothetical protein